MKHRSYDAPFRSFARVLSSARRDNPRWFATTVAAFVVALVPGRSEAARDDVLTTLNPDGVAEMVINDFPINATIIQGVISLQTDDVDCVALPTNPCTYVVNVVRMTLSDFTFSGESVTDTVAIVNGPITVTDVGEGLTIPPGTPVVVAVTVAGDRQTINSTSPTGINIMLDVADQEATISGSFVGSLEGISVDASLLATGVSPFLNLPPIANAGADQTVTCGDPAQLDGSGTTDPNGNLSLLAWSIGGASIAFGTTADVFLDPGVHDVTLTAYDTFEGQDRDTTQVTVVADTTPPEFVKRHLHPIIIDDCSTPELPQPAVRDDCAVFSLTHDAPAQFPLGRTTITWTAVDEAGNSATKTQDVFAVLGNDVSCCPAGTNVIVGTPNRDHLMGTAESDCILGLGGDDHIHGARGDDFLSGGDGNDFIVTGEYWPFHGPRPNEYVNGGFGFDLCFAPPGSTVFGCNGPGGFGYPPGFPRDFDGPFYGAR